MQGPHAATTRRDAPGWAGPAGAAHLAAMEEEALSQQIRITRSQLGADGEGHYQITAHGGDVDIMRYSESPK